MSDGSFEPYDDGGMSTSEDEKKLERMIYGNAR